MQLNINSLFQESLTSQKGGSSSEPEGSTAQWISKRTHRLKAGD